MSGFQVHNTTEISSQVLNSSRINGPALVVEALSRTFDKLQLIDTDLVLDLDQLVHSTYKPIAIDASLQTGPVSLVLGEDTAQRASELLAAFGLTEEDRMCLLNFQLVTDIARIVPLQNSSGTFDHVILTDQTTQSDNAAIITGTVPALSIVAVSGLDFTPGAEQVLFTVLKVA
jgi:hypothetical protein